MIVTDIPRMRGEQAATFTDGRKTKQSYQNQRLGVKNANKPTGNPATCPVAGSGKGRANRGRGRRRRI